MTKVFLGGSRRVGRLNNEIRAHIDSIIEDQPSIIVGDANGADKALQSYLNERGYRNVEVFCSGGRCRNNIGEWKVRVVPTAEREASFSFYSAKDLAMAQEATVGLMVWDGKSVGTLCNVLRLIRQKKSAAVYSAPEKTFRQLTSMADWRDFIRHCKSDLRRKLEKRIKVSEASEQGAVVQLTLILNADNRDTGKRDPTLVESPPIASPTRKTGRRTAARLTAGKAERRDGKKRKRPGGDS